MTTTEKSGLLDVAPAENDWSEDRIPEEWYDRRGRLTQTWRDRVPDRRLGGTRRHVTASQPRSGAVKMWWQAAPILALLELRLSSTRSQGAGFRQAGFALQRGPQQCNHGVGHVAIAAFHGGRRPTRQAAQFTDNRQDASLQAGHFNDFVHVSLLRCALHAALIADSGTTFDLRARRVVTACGLGIRDIARNTELDPQSQAAQDVWRVFTELTEYRLYEDLRGVGSVVQPNLEHVGLLRVGYRSLEWFCADNTHWQFHMLAVAMPAAERETIIRAVLDQFRRKLAISCRCLQETTQQQIRRRAEQHLNEFWGLDPDLNELRTAERYRAPGAVNPAGGRVQPRANAVRSASSFGSDSASRPATICRSSTRLSGCY